MNDQQLLRYSRHILLPEIGIDGQNTLLSSRVLIIGMGGLGSPVTLYLAASGIGHLTLVDFDEVELSNLQRQIIHDHGSLGSAKTASARAHCQRLNPDIRIDTVNHQPDENELAELVCQHDVVVDGSDNFPTRFLLNRVCHHSRTPLVSGAVIRLEGQASSFDFRAPDSPCYRCLYDENGDEDDSCSRNGVLAPVAGIIGSIQATETLKLLVGLPGLTRQVLVLDAISMTTRTLRLSKDPECPVCSKTNPEIS